MAMIISAFEHRVESGTDFNHVGISVMRARPVPLESLDLVQAQLQNFAAFTIDMA